MTFSAMKFLRKAVGIPTNKVDQREVETKIAEQEVRQAKREHNQARLNLQQRSQELRLAFDDLLGRMQ